MLKADFTDTVIDNAFCRRLYGGRYLLSAATLDIGVIPGPLERNTGAGRLAGFMKAMEEALDQRAGQLDCSGRLRAESGYYAMQQIYRSHYRPTAAFCGGDILYAMAMLCAADEMGRVPQDVSGDGCDNVRNARFLPRRADDDSPAQRLFR